MSPFCTAKVGLARSYLTSVSTIAVWCAVSYRAYREASDRIHAVIRDVCAQIGTGAVIEKASIDEVG
jgi:hypothetical protein